MNRMIIFDDGKGEFGPMCDLRAVFELRTGMLTTAGRIAAHRPKTLAGYWVPDSLKALVAHRANAPVNMLPEEEEIYCVSGRWTLPDADLELDLGEAVIEEDSQHVIVARLRHADAERLLTSGELPDRIRTTSRAGESGGGVLYRYPWHVLDHLDAALRRDISDTRLLDAKILNEDLAVMGYEPVQVAQSAMLCPNIVFDASRGPIMIHERAVIRPGVVLCGPCSIGPDSTVIDNALIKPDTVIGPACKVGGEVGGTIFQGYSNKSHDGHLGDSWIGKWVNFGAGTTNSNLLNTYCEVSMRLDAGGKRHRTGRMYLGAIVGDHVKTAINTRIMTGTVIGTGAMIATSSPPPTLVESFAWMTDEAVRRYRFDKFVEVMKTVMARREKEPGEAYVKRLEELHGQSGGS